MTKQEKGEVIIPIAGGNGIVFTVERGVCICSCGKEIEGELRNVIGGKISCECGNKIKQIRRKLPKPEMGDIFGRLLYLGNTDVFGGERHYECTCLACGKESVWIKTHNLYSMRHKSCGCLKGKRKDKIPEENKIDYDGTYVGPVTTRY